jgi:hypothetical protein
MQPMPVHVHEESIHSTRGHKFQREVCRSKDKLFVKYHKGREGKASNQAAR